MKRKNIPFKVKKMIFERDNYRCVCCGNSNRQTKLEIDHFIPFSRGGTDDIDNLITLCIDCNRQKHDDMLRFKRNNPFKDFLLKEEIEQKRNKLNSLRTITEIKRNNVSIDLSKIPTEIIEMAIKIKEKKNIKR